jgi:hypothetical protein
MWVYFGQPPGGRFTFKALSTLSCQSSSFSFNVSGTGPLRMGFVAPGAAALRACNSAGLVLCFGFLLFILLLFDSFFLFPMLVKRPPIPSVLRRRVLIEAGHRCAVCRNIQTDIHHIVPWANCKTHVYDNLIALCPNCHRLAGAGKIDRESLRIYKFNLRFAHDKYSQLEIDVLFDLRKLEPGKDIRWPRVMLIFIRRIIESEFVTIQEPPFEIDGTNETSPIQVDINGFRLDPVAITLSEKGMQFIGNLGLHKL